MLTYDWAGIQTLCVPMESTSTLQGVGTMTSDAQHHIRVHHQKWCCGEVKWWVTGERKGRKISADAQNTTHNLDPNLSPGLPILPNHTVCSVFNNKPNSNSVSLNIVLKKTHKTLLCAKQISSQPVTFNSHISPPIIKYSLYHCAAFWDARITVQVF